MVRRIVAMGGGGFSMEPDNPLLDTHILSLSGVARPRVCLLPTAGGDSDGLLAEFYTAFARRAEATHLGLVNRTVSDIEAFLLDQDVVYVGGGNTANMLAIWRVHGVDRALRAAWDAGVVLAGLSAGSICWFESGTTDSFGPELAALTGGLGFLPGSHCPHYDGEPLRRATYQRHVGAGLLPAGYAADDGAALVFEDQSLVDGSVRETRLAARYLGV